MKTEPRPQPQVTCTEIFVKSRHVVFDTCERTDRHTDMFIAIFCTHTRGEVKGNENSSGDEIANVNFYAVRPKATRIR